MKKTSIRVCVLIIASAMILSTVAVTADTEEQLPSIKYSISSRTVHGDIGPVVWDNGMDYTSLMHTQWDAGKQFDFYLADDFYFDEDTEVADVQWVGGYWGEDYQTGDFNWYISFYYDNTTEDEPDGHPQTPSFAGPYYFAWNEIGKELLYDSGNSVYYVLWVDLPEIIIFEAGHKFWISIWAEGAYPPQSGWGYHKTFLLNPAVLGSDYFGFPFWTPGFDIQGFDFDMAFQLTGPIGPFPPTPPYIDGPREGFAGIELCWTFHSDDPNGDDVKYIIDWGDGTTIETEYNSSCTPVELCHTYNKKGVYAIIAYAEDETGLTSNESTFGVVIPRVRSVYHPLILRLLEQFPILERLINLLR